jgi:hypothetical protein
MLMEKDKEKHKGHSTVMTVMQTFLKLEVPLLIYDRYRVISARTQLRQFEKLKRGLLSSIYKLKYSSCNISHEKLLCNVETAGS